MVRSKKPEIKKKDDMAIRKLQPDEIDYIRYVEGN